jgi:putative two-component system response regulator
MVTLTLRVLPARMYLKYPAATAATRSVITTLIVDPDSAGRLALERLVTALGHEAVAVATGEEAVAESARRKLACILLDDTLPGTTAPEMVDTLLAREPGAAIVILSASNSVATAVECLRRGAMDCVPRSFEPTVIEAALQRALARRRELLDQAETQDWLRRENIRQEAELRRERENLEHVSVATLEALVNALEAKDAYLRGHSARIADLSAMVAAELGLNDGQVELVRVAGRLHDIGKIGIRESVLAKAGPLDPDEFAHVRTHVVIGAQILAPLTHLREVIGYVRSHHERVDGTGYPDHLEGDAIPLGARILGAAEVFDALTTSRPYQDKMAPEEAVARMRDLIGTVLSAEVHRALDSVVSRRGILSFLDDLDARPVHAVP